MVAGSAGRMRALVVYQLYHDHGTTTTALLLNGLWYSPGCSSPIEPWPLPLLCLPVHLHLLFFSLGPILLYQAVTPAVAHVTSPLPALPPLFLFALALALSSCLLLLVLLLFVISIY